ncbi:MAG: hypothetical protein ACXVCE_12655, partial [Bacteriovorax sp.]
HGWRLDAIKTTLGLTLEGKMGVKSWAGEKAIELTWKKRTNKNAEEDEDDFRAGTVNFQGIRGAHDLQKSMDQLASGLAAKGKVRDALLLKRNLMKKALLFQEMIKGAEASEVSPWMPYKIRLDLSVSADGTVSPVMNAGGNIRMRFVWSKSGTEGKEKSVLGKVAESSRTLLNNLAEQMAVAIKEEPASKKLTIENFNVSIGVSLSGNVGVAEASGEIVTQVFFRPFEESESGEKVLRSNALIKTNSAIPFLRNNHNNFLEQVTFIDGTKIRKGFKKAVRFAEYFQKKLEKEKYKKSDWAVSEISPSFTFGLSGDVGLATLEGTAGLEIEFHNAHF